MDEELLNLIKQSNSFVSLAKNLGLTVKTAKFKKIKKDIINNNVDISHFNFLNANKKIEDEELFVSACKSIPLWSQRRAIKSRLAKNNVKDLTKCEMCGISNIWNGKKFSMILDHINGINNDNRVENLRIICPNCNATLPTYCVGNRNKDV